MTKHADGERRLRQVVEGGYCIGCGACAAVAPEGCRVGFDPSGFLAAEITPSPDADFDKAARVCPFATETASDPDENTLAAEWFADAPGRSGAIGRHIACYVGAVGAEAGREIGSSGGYITWLLKALLETGMVDAVIHVRRVEDPAAGDRLFEYARSATPDEIDAGARSRYYPVSLDRILADIRGSEARVAVTGVPCFIKAVRLLQAEEPVFRDRIRFAVGLVCGHMKSRRFAEFLAWQAGIPPGSLETIDFRDKLPDRPANRYGMRARGRDGTEVAAPMSDLMGADWGLGYFKYSACNFCDDVFAETADVAVGDAWLPEEVGDWRGSNVVVVRDRRLFELTEAAIETGDLALHRKSADTMIMSQMGGLRERRAGLAYRLNLAQAKGAWAPRKRVNPDAFARDPWYRRLQDLRMAAATEIEHAYDAARAARDLDLFWPRAAPAIDAYRAHADTLVAKGRRYLRKQADRLRLRLNLSLEGRYLR